MHANYGLPTEGASVFNLEFDAIGVQIHFVCRAVACPMNGCCFCTAHLDG